MEEFKDRLSKLVAGSGLMKKDVAGKLGMEYRNFRYYELGVRTPDADMLRKMCDLFGVSVGYLLNGDSMETNSVSAEFDESYNRAQYNGATDRKFTTTKGAWAALGYAEIKVYASTWAGDDPFAESQVIRVTQVRLKGLADLAEYFGLDVPDEAMGTDDIHKGDSVLVHKQDTVTSGKIAAVAIGQKMLVRRITFRGQRVLLTASNPEFEPLEVRRTSLTIYGQVVRRVNEKEFM